MSKVDKSDILLLLGLILLGAGLYCWWGLGQALAVAGGLLFSLGLAGNIATAPGRSK